MKARQRGTTLVEFSVAGSVALLVLLASIEIGRVLYVWNLLGEATRRAARLAAVCPMNDAAIKQNALVVSADGVTSEVLGGLTTANVTVSYLDATGTVTASYPSVAFVRVQITGYSQTLFLPFVGGTFTAPSFTTTVPAESLGWIPELGVRTCL